VATDVAGKIQEVEMLNSLRWIVLSIPT
jgi:hypothetical protein